MNEELIILEEVDSTLIIPEHSDEEIDITEELDEELVILEQDDCEIVLVEDDEEDNLVCIEDDIKIISPKLQTKEVYPKTYIQEVTPDSEYNGLDLVVVNAVNPSDYYKEEESIIVNPNITSQEIYPSENKVINKVSVNAVDKNIDPNIKSENIKKGITILDVTGTLEPDKPDQIKNIIPTTNIQKVTPDDGYELTEVVVDAVNPSDYYKEEVALNINPTENIQVINPPDGKVINLVNVDAIPSDYIGSQVNRIHGLAVEPTTNEQIVVNANTFVTGDVIVEPVNPSDYYKEEERVVITPTTSEQTILPSENKAIGEVFVNAVEPSDYYKPEVVGRVKSSLSEVTYKPSAGNVYREVVVEPILLQSKVVHDNGTIKPDVGYDGLSEVRVNVPKPAPVLIEKNITENGTYISIDDSADGYSVVNVNVESTGGQTSRVDGKYLCRIYDYDGSLVQPDQWLNEGDIFTLPELPTHDGLIAQGWITPAPMPNNTITVTNQDLICSVAYTTASGMTEIDIELTPLTGLDVPLKFNGVKDWGDGTTNSANGHTYAEYGKYTIKCSDTMQSCTSSSRLFGQTGTNPNFSCVAIRFGDITTPIQSYSLGYCQSLKYCTISNAITTVGTYAFEYCYGLTTISMGQNVATIANGAFRYCVSLTDICIPAKVTTVTAQAFQSCFSLSHLSLHQNIKTISTYAFQSTLMRKIAIPNSVQQATGFVFAACQTIQEVVFPVNFQNIQANAFNGNSSTIKYDFSKVAKVCVLSGTNAFNGINPICKIVVPDSLYYTWIATTNWTTYADYIYKASEV